MSSPTFLRRSDHRRSSVMSPFGLRHEPGGGARRPLTSRRVEAEPLYRRLIGVVTVTGALWRLAMLISKWNTPLLLNDAFYYSVQAFENSRGNWYRQPFSTLPSAEHPPLTSLVLTPSSLLSNPVAWQRATMTVLGIALIPLIAMVGRRVAGRRVGVIAAVLAAVYANLWMSDSLVMS